MISPVAVEKSRFWPQTAKISGMENVWQSEKIAHKRNLTQFYFCEFSSKEFFNSHA